MRNSFAMLAVTAALLAGLPPAGHAQAPGPVLQQVVISGHRLRFDNSNAAIVRYILIDPGTPTRPGTASRRLSA